MLIPLMYVYPSTEDGEQLRAIQARTRILNAGVPIRTLLRKSS